MASPPPTPNNFKNHYYQRAVATAKPCFICHRPTTIVLATVDTSDFLYTCASHLTDTGFATPIASTTASGSTTPVGKDKPKLSDAEIKKIAEEWEEKQRLKKEKEKEKEKEKDKDKDGGDKDKDKKADEKKVSSPAPSIPSPSTSISTPTPTHPQFTLHRQIFAMRQAEQRKRRQASQVKQMPLRLPSVPTS